LCSFGLWKHPAFHYSEGEEMRGKKVLVEARQENFNPPCVSYAGIEDWWYVEATDIHEHPGVPVADLVRECELAAAPGTMPLLVVEQFEYNALVDAREAAKKPQFEPGQEVTLAGKVVGMLHEGSVSVEIRHPVGIETFRIVANPEDIKVRVFDDEEE